MRTLAAVPVRRGCRCDPAYVRSVIAKFPPEERAEMVGEDGKITVDCEFCSSKFEFAPEEVAPGRA